MEQSEELLRSHRDAAARGELIEAGAFCRDYGQMVGHKVAASRVHGRLAGAGWRRVAPRPGHPRKDPAAEGALNYARHGGR